MSTTSDSRDRWAMLRSLVLLVHKPARHTKKKLSEPEFSELKNLQNCVLDKPGFSMSTTPDSRDRWVMLRSLVLLAHKPAIYTNEDEKGPGLLVRRPTKGELSESEFSELKNLQNCVLDKPGFSMSTTPDSRDRWATCYGRWYCWRTSLPDIPRTAKNGPRLVRRLTKARER